MDCDVFGKIENVLKGRGMDLLQLGHCLDRFVGCLHVSRFETPRLARPVGLPNFRPCRKPNDRSVLDDPRARLPTHNRFAVLSHRRARRPPHASPTWLTTTGTARRRGCLPASLRFAPFETTSKPRRSPPLPASRARVHVDGHRITSYASR